MPNTETVTIPESGVSFGPYSAEDLFYMEHSDVYRKLGQGFSTVEFLVVNELGHFIFVEAKSSSPRPGQPDSTRFDEFIDEIAVKFQDSYELFLSSVLNRQQTAEMGAHVRRLPEGSAKIKFVLVIPTHPTPWLPPLLEALKLRLRKTLRIWSIEVAVMNEGLARTYKLIS